MLQGLVLREHSPNTALPAGGGASALIPPTSSAPTEQPGPPSARNLQPSGTIFLHPHFTDEESESERRPRPNSRRAVELERGLWFQTHVHPGKRKPHKSWLESSQQHRSHQAEHGNSPGAQQLMVTLAKCDASTPESPSLPERNKGMTGCMAASPPGATRKQPITEDRVLRVPVAKKCPE